MLAWLLVGHLVGDFLLQNAWMAEDKGENIAALSVHARVYTCAVWLASLPAGGLGAAGVLLAFASHAVIDRRGPVLWWRRHVTRAEGSAWLVIMADQSLHCVFLSLASQAAICLTSKRYSDEVTELLNSFVRVMSAAIDARSPYNAKHTRNMAVYARKFVAWLNETGAESFDEDRERRFIMSVWLHDIGKLVVPLEVMDKASRLGSKITEVRHRFQVMGLQNEINYLRGSIGKDERDSRDAVLNAARELVEKYDGAGFLQDSALEEIRALGSAKAMGPEGETPYLTDDELQCLLVRKGTLTDEERRVMESHVTMTRRMLNEMSFPKRYRSIPVWASSHHEYLNGTVSAWTTPP